MDTYKINTDLSDVEKKLTEMCQNVIRKTIESQKEEVAKELEAQKKRMESKSNSPLIKLNVGGRKFTTSLATLTSNPESKLAQMFTGSFPIIKDEKGVYFIDRNGEYFAYILDILRDSTTILPTEQFLSKKIREEIDYYQIKLGSVTQLANSANWTWDPSKQSGVSLSNNNLSVSKVGSAGSGITYANVNLESGIYRWKIKITNVANSYWVSAGIVSEVEAPFSPNFSYSNCWGFSSYGNIYRMTGSGQNVKLVTGDVYEMEFNSDTKEFRLEVAGKVSLTAIVNGQKLKPFGYVWSVNDCLTISFD